ncbi:YwqH-like family protein [Shouchella clausii]|uniref:YwqH-like family protein n=1 Tax=Shouchella clausii TaxID=79880 RepID=UPI000BA625CD|nr:DUF5082 family protein [Shouchella clausii]PAD91732.1 hypothetical protein CHH52_14030 [Shouchella clausii]
MSVEFYRNRIRETENAIQAANEKIARLRACRAHLIGQEIIMGDTKHTFKEPELTKENWYGKHADELDAERESEVVSPYQDLLNEVGDTIEKATNEISATQDVVNFQSSLLSNYQIGLERAIEREKEE